MFFILPIFTTHVDVVLRCAMSDHMVTRQKDPKGGQRHRLKKTFAWLVKVANMEQSDMWSQPEQAQGSSLPIATSVIHAQAGQANLTFILVSTHCALES